MKHGNSSIILPNTDQTERKPVKRSKAWIWVWALPSSRSMTLNMHKKKKLKKLREIQINFVFFITWKYMKTSEKQEKKEQGHKVEGMRRVNFNWFVGVRQHIPLPPHHVYNQRDIGEDSFSRLACCCHDLTLSLRGSQRIPDRMFGSVWTQDGNVLFLAKIE